MLQEKPACENRLQEKKWRHLVGNAEQGKTLEGKSRRGQGNKKRRGEGEVRG